MPSCGLKLDDDEENTISCDDFYKMLNGSMDCKDNATVETCLITRQPCSKNIIKLPCGHTFDYINILREIYVQKCVNSKKKINVVRMGVGQIQCPYCRTIHTGLLPYYPIKGAKRLYGVNSPAKYAMKTDNCCEWKFKSGKRKNTLCGDAGYSVVCGEVDGGLYCTKHHRANQTNAEKQTNADNQTNAEKQTIDQTV